MNFTKIKKWLGILCAAILTAGFGAGALATSTQNGGEITAKAATEEVSVKELKERYGLNHVIGPYNPKIWYNDEGQVYSAKADGTPTEYESKNSGDFPIKDGVEYDKNNPYGIPNDSYFDAASYPRFLGYNCAGEVVAISRI